jgi:hypothetical protein
VLVVNPSGPDYDVAEHMPYCCRVQPAIEFIAVDQSAVNIEDDARPRHMVSLSGFAPFGQGTENDRADRPWSGRSGKAAWVDIHLMRHSPAVALICRYIGVIAMT